ncbi:MAG: cytochrome P450 [Halioglobus sp.]|nr:cytochrome P450 [Halioglobus sp.]
MSETAITEPGEQILRPIGTGFFETWRLVRASYNNPLGHAQELHERYGNAAMQKLFGMTFVNLYGADSHRLTLINDGQVFSNKKAWDLIIGRIFPNGLMLRDGDDHRYHRRLMQAGFKNAALKRYHQEMVPQVEQAVAAWPAEPGKQLPVFPVFKQMTLDLAASIFLGLELGPEASRVNKAFETTVAASMPRIPFAFPGTLLWRGIRARQYMSDLFRGLLPQKREGDGQDMFALLSRATDEEGNRYTDQEVVDHMIFLMMAAHDTTTSTLTSMSYALAKFPDWQDRLLEEVQGLGVAHLDYDDLERLPLTEQVMKEALRMYPPLSTLPRYNLENVEFEGHVIPAGTIVTTFPIHTHYMPENWTDPERFDPERFNDERAEHRRHSHCWVPFGGGAHMCIGLHFAIMQIKLVMFEMLKTYRWSIPAGYTMPVQQSPISKPRDGLPLLFERR